MKETKKRIQLCIGNFTKEGSQIYVNPSILSRKDIEWIKNKNKDHKDPYVEKIKARD